MAKMSLRVMGFIDGAYLIKGLKDLWGKEYTPNHVIYFLEGFKYYIQPIADLRDIRHGRVKSLSNLLLGRPILSLVRIFFYDAELSPERKSLLDTIGKINYVTLRLGRVRESGGKPIEQKGVDVLMAIDLITKAFRNQFDIAVVITGDDDLLDAVKTVKDTGKLVCGFFFKEHISPNLRKEYDVKVELQPDFILMLEGIR